jgi:hypothetical protein
MQFRLSAIQDEGMPDSMNQARLWLEDWINKALAGADFGCNDMTLMIVVFATTSLPGEPAVSRLSANTPDGQTLAVHISIDPELIRRTKPDAQLALLASHIGSQLSAKPLRKPKLLDYERMRQAVLLAIFPFVYGAA